MSETIKLKRVRKSKFKVNFILPTGGYHSYLFPAATDKKVTELEVPKEVVDYLSSFTTTFRDGELVIVEDSDFAKEVVETIPYSEEYKANIMTSEEIQSMLRGNIMKMKKALTEITSKAEQRNVLDHAEEIKDELPNGKLKALAEWIGVKQEDLFGDDE